MSVFGTICQIKLIKVWLTLNLNHKVVLVTGGGSGIGREIAILMAARGATVAILDVDFALAKSVEREILSRNKKCLAIHGDVSNSAQVGKAYKIVLSTFGSLSILVNCAGIGTNETTLTTTESLWETIMNTNVKGVFICSKIAANIMVNQKSGGSIINICSTSADNARVGGAAYATSKAGVVQFTKSLALEMGPHKIRVNAVSPSLPDFDHGDNTKTTQAYRKAFVAQIPIGRTAQAKEVAKAVIFLASEESEFITGEVIHVDGGYSAGKFTVKD